jgi:hypothetical protein
VNEELTLEVAIRVVADGSDWQPIDTAPFDEDVTLLVTDGRGAPLPNSVSMQA